MLDFPPPTDPSPCNSRLPCWRGDGRCRRRGLPPRARVDACIVPTIHLIARRYVTTTLLPPRRAAPVACFPPSDDLYLLADPSSDSSRFTYFVHAPLRVVQTSVLLPGAFVARITARIFSSLADTSARTISLRQRVAIASSPTVPSEGGSSYFRYPPPSTQSPSAHSGFSYLFFVSRHWITHNPAGAPGGYLLPFLLQRRTNPGTAVAFARLCPRGSGAPVPAVSTRLQKRRSAYRCHARGAHTSVFQRYCRHLLLELPPG